MVAPWRHHRCFHVPGWAIVALSAVAPLLVLDDVADGQVLRPQVGFISNFLDLTPLGRQEPWEEPKGRATVFGTGARDTLRYHDEYDE
jgi:hypothetical protein